MHLFEHMEDAIYIEVDGQFYPSSVYLEALRRADNDKRLQREIDEIEKRYLKLHLEQVTKEHEESKRDLETIKEICNEIHSN